MGPASWLSCHALVHLSPRKTRCWFQHKPSKARVKKSYEFWNFSFCLKFVCTFFLIHDQPSGVRWCVIEDDLLFTPSVPVSMWTSEVCARVTWGAAHLFFLFLFFFAKPSLKVKTGWEPGRCVPAAGTKFSNFHSNTKYQARSVPAEQHLICALTWDNTGRSGGGLHGGEHGFDAPAIVFGRGVFSSFHTCPIPSLLPPLFLTPPRPPSNRVRIMVMAVKTRCLPGGNAEGLSEDD